MILEGWKVCRILLDGCLDFIDVVKTYAIIVYPPCFSLYFYPIKTLI